MDWPAVMYAEVGFMKRRGLVGTLDSSKSRLAHRVRI